MPQQDIPHRLADTDRAIIATRFDIKNSGEYAALPIDLQEFIDAQLFSASEIDNRTPSSILSARRASAAALLGAAQLFFYDLHGEAPEPFFATFAYLDGEVAMGSRLRNVQTMIEAARSALIAHGMEGILTPDIDLLVLRGKRDPLVAFHLHGIVWSIRSSKRKLRLKNTAEKMALKIDRPSRLNHGCNLTGKRPGDFRFHAETMATYAGKAVAALKIETRKDGKSRFSRDRALFTPKHAFNLLYAWSQIAVVDNVVPVGLQGKELHQIWLQKVKRRSFLGLTDHVLESDRVEDLWQEVLDSVNSGKKVRTPLCSI